MSRSAGRGIVYPFDREQLPEQGRTKTDLSGAGKRNVSHALPGKKGRVAGMIGGSLTLERVTGKGDGMKGIGHGIDDKEGKTHRKRVGIEGCRMAQAQNPGKGEEREGGEDAGTDIATVQLAVNAYIATVQVRRDKTISKMGSSWHC